MSISNIDIATKFTDRKKIYNQTRDADYWSRRRTFWRAESARLGTDWRSIAVWIVDIDTWNQRRRPRGALLNERGR
jgi:hypothetical protein